MPFGKYKGCRVEDLPDQYLSDLLEFDLREPLRSAVNREIDARFYGHPREPEQPAAAAAGSIELRADEVSLARRIFDAGFRSLARTAHPDVGGDAAEMRALNALAESIRDQLRALEATCPLR
jgi:hypothetical protein